MKKIKLIALFFILVFSSCQKEDNDINVLFIDTMNLEYTYDMNTFVAERIYENKTLRIGMFDEIDNTDICLFFNIDSNEIVKITQNQNNILYYHGGNYTYKGVSVIEDYTDNYIKGNLSGKLYMFNGVDSCDFHITFYHSIDYELFKKL